MSFYVDWLGPDVWGDSGAEMTTTFQTRKSVFEGKSIRAEYRGQESNSFGSCSVEAV